jgi:hypothetical protein
MSPQILLAQKIGKYFKLHPSREETFIAMIFSAIASGNVHQSDLARYVGSPNHRSGLRRVERFFLKSH